MSNDVARYAQGDDYHHVLDLILRYIEAELVQVIPEIRTWRYVDTGPLSDRASAAQAGLGLIGKNGLLIDEEHCSYTFIGPLLAPLQNENPPGPLPPRTPTCTPRLHPPPTPPLLP